MSYLEKYHKYKSKYLKIKNQSGGGKHHVILLGNIRGESLKYIPELDKQLKNSL